MKSNSSRLTRREFLPAAGTAVAACYFVPRHVLGGQGQQAPSDKLNIAAIGIGGRGRANLDGVRGENVVGLCDVDERQTGSAYERFPKAKRYRDFRKMLDDLDSQIDAVVVSTPDHTHAVACMDVLQRGKHLYCEKPLAHSIHEVRRIVEAAGASKVVTQLGNQGHSSGSIRVFCEWIWDGAIGQVTEVHAACGAFKEVYCQIDKLPQLQEKHEIPPELDWDLWLGPAEYRSYHPVYVPFTWRGWTAFGTGTIGDWVCHIVEPAYWALDLGAPRTVEAEVDGYDPVKHKESYPKGTKITFQFPAKGDRGPVKLVWYDGVRTLPRPAELEEGRNPPDTGAIVMGDQGTIMYGSHGAGGVRLIPDTKMRAYQKPEPAIPRVAGHYEDWLQAIREGRPAGANFPYGGPLTEIGLLGLIATKLPGIQLDWDAANMRFTNCDEANEFVRPEYRQGWTL